MKHRISTLFALALAPGLATTACDRPTAPGVIAISDPPRTSSVDLPAPLLAYAKRIAAIPVAEGVSESRESGTGPAASSGSRSATIFVDDDGEQCRAAFTTIQAAVAAAVPGTTIVVCAGTYHGTVEIVGPAKNGIQVIAKGSEDRSEEDWAEGSRGEGSEVVLAGDHTEENGFLLQDVTGVRIQGFVVRDFGMGHSVPAAPGMGNDILLLRAHGNTISRNLVTRSDMMGIFLVNSGDNLVEHNVARDNDAQAHGFGCGIMLFANPTGSALSANNVFRDNLSTGNPLAGIMIQGGGAGTVLSRNRASGNGRFGVRVWDTRNTVIERNAMNDSRGLWTDPAADQFARGLDIRRSPGSTVTRNIAFNNGVAAGSYDIFWDGIAVIFSRNRCATSQPPGLCERSN